MWNPISDLKALQENSVEFFLFRVWLLDALKRTLKIFTKRLLSKGIKKRRLKFNPGLALIGLQTTGPRSVHCDHGLSIFSSAGWLSVVNKHCYVSFFIFSSFFLSCTLCSSMPGCASFFSMACTIMHSLHTNFNVVQQDSMQGHMGHLIITNIAVRNFSDGRVSTDVI